MTELVADLFVSLDGYASGSDVGPYFGFDGPELSRWVHTNLDRPQVLLMGRNTYAALAGIAGVASDEVSRRMGELPKVVFSRTLAEPLGWRNSRVIAGDLAREIRALKQNVREPLRTIGSLQLVKELMELRLVDRLRLMVFPLMLGSSGRERFDVADSRLALRPIAASVLDSRLVLLEYGPAA